MLVAIETGRVKIFRLTPGGHAVTLYLFRSSEFAAAIGVAPESLSRAITKLVSAGVLRRLAPRRFQLLDAAALSGAAKEAMA